MNYKNIKDIKPLERNPRYIKDAQFEKLCKSIKQNAAYFEARPIILSDRTGELIIIAGNQRYAAAKEIGLSEVPIYLMSGLTEKEEQEIIIKDNVHNGDFDYDILSADYDPIDLADWGFTDEQLGISDDDVKPIIEDKEEFWVGVQCENETDQQQLYEELQEKGYKCKLMN